MKFLKGMLSSWFKRQASGFQLGEGGWLQPYIIRLNEHQTEFWHYLRGNFDEDTADRVVDAFHRMKLPPPQTDDEFLHGTKGALVFLNAYGMVIRIEQADPAKGLFKADRINDSPWMLQPLASLDAGKVIIELCPGCHCSDNSWDVAYLHDALLKQGHAFWDQGLANVGLLPVKTPRFPEGIPIVIDRLAVKKLTESTEAIRQAIAGIEVGNDEIQEAAEAQERLYAPLRLAFDEAWADGSKMPQFWNLCQEYVREGKLVAGWNHPEGMDTPEKALMVVKTAAGYEKRLKSSAELKGLNPPPGGPS